MLTKNLTKYLDKRGTSKQPTIYKESTNTFVTNEEKAYYVNKNVSLPTSTYTQKNNDAYILCDGTFTVTLLAVSGRSGNMIWIKNIGSGTITVDGDGSETIDGEATQELYANEAICIICDGSNWQVI